MIEFREPPRTGFELTWQMFGIRFRVFPSFFLVYGLIAALIAWPKVGGDLSSLGFTLAIVLACLFVGILFVSFVQGIVYKSYGLRSTVVVREFTSGLYPETLPPTSLQRIAVALSYPAACFLLFVVVFYSNQHFEWSKTSRVTQIVYLLLKSISLIWAILGLLPIYPYSGGRVMFEILHSMSPRNGLAVTLTISIAVAIAYIVYTAAEWMGKIQEFELRPGIVIPANIIVAVFFGLSAAQNWQILQSIRSRPRVYQAEDYDDQRPWDR